MSTPPPGTDPAQKTELETEKNELETEVQETEAEAEKARQAGDTARAEQLEAQIKKVVSGELAEIKETLKALSDRPFHPAPEANKPPAGTTEDPPKTEGQEEQQPKEKVHRFGSTKWFKDRAYED